jgi:hypothetical protein
MRRVIKPAPPPDLWRDYRRALVRYEQALRGLSYRDLPIPSAPSRSLPTKSLSVSQIETLLHIDDKPHGYQLIEPAALPVFPSPPLQPPADQPLPLWRRIFWAPPKSRLSPVERKAQVERASKLQSESEALRLKFTTQANRWVRVKQGAKLASRKQSRSSNFKPPKDPPHGRLTRRLSQLDVVGPQGNGGVLPITILYCKVFSLSFDLCPCGAPSSRDRWGNR